MAPSADVFEFHVQASSTASLLASARIVRFQGVERVSRPYRYDIVFVLPRTTDVGTVSLLGAHASLSIHRGASATESRVVHGVIEKVDFESRKDPETVEVHVRLVAELALLRKTKQSRVFQGLTAPAIVERILGAAGIAVRLALSHDYAARDICIQYMESDLEFVERILSEEGIFYLFDQDEERERVVLSDDVASVPSIPFVGETFLRPDDGMTERPTDVTAFRSDVRVTPKRVALKEFDFERPSFTLVANAEAAEGDARLEIYEHHGEHGGLDVRPAAATRRLEQARVKTRTAEGTSHVHAFTAGHSFTLSSAMPEQDGVYTLLEIRHVGRVPELDPGAKRVYENRFVCVPHAVAPRPRARARRIQESLITATVVGPRGQEIHTDAFGRVRVAFHWDREARHDETSSCWIRVAQTWAGAGWGFQFIPRIGMEVLVAFVGGDLDRPLVVSAVPNLEHPVPFPLPQSKSKSGIRTESTRGGSGFHELSFEDRKGYERLYLHAQRDYEEDVLRHHQSRVGGDKLTLVAGSSTSEIGGEELTVVKGSRVTAVAEDDALTIAGSSRTQVAGDHLVEVKKDWSRSVDGGASEIVAGDASSEVRGSQKNVVRGERHDTIHGRHEIEARGGEIASVFGDAQRLVSGTLGVSAAALSATVGRAKERVYLNVDKTGDASVDAASDIVVRAGKSITFTVGKSTLVLDEDGIRFEGKTVTTDAGRVELVAGGASLALEKTIEGAGEEAILVSDSGGSLGLDANAKLTGAKVQLGAGASADKLTRADRKADEPKVPKAKVVLFDLGGKRCNGATYEVSVPGWTKNGTADDGSVEVPLFADVETCRMRWGRPPTERDEGATEDEFEFDKTIFLVTEAEKPEDALRRKLSNLGHGHVDLPAAIAAFEAHKGLDGGSLPRSGDLGKAHDAVGEQHARAQPAKQGEPA